MGAGFAEPTIVQQSGYGGFRKASTHPTELRNRDSHPFYSSVEIRIGRFRLMSMFQRWIKRTFRGNKPCGKFQNGGRD